MLSWVLAQTKFSDRDAQSFKDEGKILRSILYIFQTDGGKTELSLIHFTLTNPDWRPPESSTKFLQSVLTRARDEMAPAAPGDNRVPSLPAIDQSLLLNSAMSLSHGDGLAMPFFAAGNPVMVSLFQGLLSFERCV